MRITRKKPEYYKSFCFSVAIKFILSTIHFIQLFMLLALFRDDTIFKTLKNTINTLNTHKNVRYRIGYKGEFNVYLYA